MKPRPGRSIGGKYRLLQPLAAGGMGSVWRARHAELDADVAVKLLSSELAGSSAAAERFKREARAAAKLKSVHVVQIHDYGLEAGQPYMVMELLDGEDLKHRLRREGPVSIKRALEILRPVCKALQAAHEAGIVHCDVKPANVFLAHAGQDEVVKVLDFGIAKVRALALVDPDSGRGAMMGSPMYMSPEQAEGTGVDHRSDLWSAAVMVFEALTGRHPFVDSAVDDVFARIRRGELKLPSDFGVVHPGLDALVQKALDRDPARRFQSALELAEAFAEIVSASPEPDRAPPRPAKPDPQQARTGSSTSRGPERRGRESDTLALATTQGDALRQVAVARWRARALGGLATAAVIGGAAVAWHRTARGGLDAGEPRAMAGEATPDTEASARAADDTPPPPPTSTASLERSSPPQPGPSQQLEHATTRPAAPSATAVPRPSRPRSASASASAPTSASQAPPAAAATASSRLDPIFGVPVTTP